MRGRRALITVLESQRGQDLNGDGDQSDSVLHTFDVDSGLLVNHGLWAQRSRGLSHSGYEQRDGDGRFLPLYVAESAQSADLNGDGDQEDFVLHLYDYEGASLTNSGLGVVQGGELPSFPAVTGGILRFNVDESQQQADFNGDGDTLDAVLVLQEPLTGRTTNLGLAVTADHLLVGVWEAEQGETDLNGNGLPTEEVAHVVPLFGRRPF